MGRVLIRRFCLFAVAIAIAFASAGYRPAKPKAMAAQAKGPLKNTGLTSQNVKTIHVFVALCDNKYQGIVPVPAKIGNGQDPELNLYWGCDNGVRTFFKKSKNWKLVKKQKLNDTVLERLIFKNTSKNYYL